MAGPSPEHRTRSARTRDQRDAFVAKLDRGLRLRRLSSRQLARKAGVPLGTLSNYATGRSTPKLGDALAIAEALGIDLCYFADARVPAGAIGGYLLVPPSGDPGEAGDGPPTDRGHADRLRPSALARLLREDDPWSLAVLGFALRLGPRRAAELLEQAAGGGEGAAHPLDA